MKNFFKGYQVGIFRRLARKYKAYCRNTQFLDEETKKAIEEVNSILSLEKPYSQISQLSMLEKKIEISIQEALSAQKEKVKESLDLVTKELEKDLSDEKYSDNFRESVLQLFNVIGRTTENAEDCALVQSQLPTINSHRVEAYRLKDAENQRIREEQQKLDKDKIIKVPEVPQRTTEVISDMSLFKSKKMLENEADIEEYITQLREKLLKILKVKNIIV